MISLKNLFIALIAASEVIAHNKYESLEELSFRVAHTEKTRRALQQRGSSLLRRDSNEKRVAVRSGLVDSHLTSLGLASKASMNRRDWIYDGKNASCILTPEGEEGPYYVNGSLIRHDIRESQKGIPLILDVQLTDVTTCAPISGVMIDFWMANSTGVYSNEESEGTLGETQLRGIQRTDNYGLVQILTIVPGWYAGRAQHIHVKAHVNYTTHANNTISFGKIVHTGQMFFQQTTLKQINKVYPYTLDTNQFTLNTADRVIQDQQNTSYYDAFIEMRSLGYNISAGFVGFINMAIDPTSTPAAVGGGGGGAAPGGNGTMPSGSIPSGVVPSSTSTNAAARSSSVSSSGAAQTKAPIADLIKRILG